MKKILLSISVIFIFFSCATTVDKKNVQKPVAVSLEGSPSELYAQAKASFDMTDYDKAIAILNQLTMEDPTSWKINILLCKAQVEKAAILKMYRDKEYLKLLKKAYRKAKLLRKMNKFHPDPYYIAARVLIVKDAPGSLDQAENYIKRALSVSPDNPLYLRTLEHIKIKKKARVGSRGLSEK